MKRITASRIGIEQSIEWELAFAYSADPTKTSRGGGLQGPFPVIDRHEAQPVWRRQ